MIRYFLFIAIIMLLACNAEKHNKKNVELAMQRYNHLILQLDADSIALLFTPNGNLGDIAVGRDSIKKFLSSFKDIKVLSQNSSTTSIIIKGDSAIQKGLYQQSDIIAKKDTMYVKGEYTALWQWLPQQGWRIKKMVTKPIK